MAAYEEPELDQKLEEKARKKFNFEIEEEWSEGAKSESIKVDTLVHAAHGNGTAFIEVLMGDDQKQLVIYSLLVKDDEDEEEKKEPKEDRFGDKTLVKVYQSTKANVIFVISQKDLGEASSNAIIKKLLNWIQPASIL